MILHQLLRHIQTSALARLVRDTRGVSAVEFVLITPAILSLFFGTVEISQGVDVDRKVTITARALSDLVAQSTTINDTDMTNIFNAASAILTPYPVSDLTAKVSAVNIDGSGNATIAWGSALYTTARTKGDPATIPTALRMPNSQVIWSEITYTYKPTFAKFFAASVNLSDEFFARPRQTSTICRPPQQTTCS